MKLLYSLVLLLLSINCILSFNRHQLPINHNSYRGCDRGRDSSVGSATRATTTAINEIPIAKSTSTKIRFIRTNETSAHKPPLLYVPGLDGVGNYSAENFANLTENFDVWRMIVSPDDRSSFVEISNLIVGQVNSFQQPAVVIGESFGGLMSLYVSLRTKNVQKLVLVNPATSYDRTIWPTAGPLIASLGSTVYPAVGIATLLATVVEREQFVRIGRQIVDKINSTESAVAEMNKLLASGNLITELLPPETLDWRLKQWLGVGAFVMKNKLKEVTTDTIILVGSDDRLIPSKDEGKRLKREIVNAQVELRTFNRRGHALLDDSFNLPKVLRTSKLFRSALGEEAVIVNEMPPPTAESIADADKYIENFKKIFSPVFISRSKTGKLTFGIKDIPVGTSGRPVLLVGNHQLFGTLSSWLLRNCS